MKQNSKHIIDDDLIPYACHVDANTIITKNGMLIQTITFNTNLDSQESFRDQIRKSIVEYYNPDIAIYIHTIKISNYDNVIANNVKRFEEIIIHKISEICKFTATNEISFNITYVTKILNKNGTNFLSTFSSSGYYKKHDLYIKRGIKRLNKITDGILQEFKDYNPIKLGIVLKDRQYQSQYMNFLSKLINFTDEEFSLPVGSLCYSTNCSEHKFGKNKFLVRSDTKSQYAKTFSVKEYSEISCDAIYRMLESIPNVIICQVVIPVNNETLIKEYAKIAEIYKASTDKEFKSSSALQYMTQLLESKGRDSVYAKSQLNITIFERTQADLINVSKIIADVFAKTGIVAFAEDVHLQNAFFSTIPGNFRFLSRLSNIPIAIIAGFAYSQGSDKMENNNFMWGKILFTLQKTNNRRFEFGMPFEQRNMLIVGHEGSGKGILANLLMLGAVKNDIRVIYIDTSHRSDAASHLAGLELINISFKNDHKTKKMNPFADIKKEDAKYVQNMVKLMAGENAKNISTQKLESLSYDIIESFGLNLQDTIKSNGLTNELQDFIQVGKFAQIFENQNQDDAISMEKDARIVVNEDVLQDKKLSAIINFTILYKITKLLQSNKNTIIIMNNVFDIFKTNIETKLLQQLLINAKESTQISFVFVSNAEIDKINNSKIKDVILSNSEHKIHFGNERLGLINGYKDCFNISGKDIDILQTLDRNYGRSFAIFTPYTKEYIKFNLSELNNDLRIISDGSGRSMEILQEKIIDFGINDRRDMYEHLIYEIENYTGLTDDEVVHQEIHQDVLSDIAI